MLLDEPTNHLDVDAIEWLEAELKSSPNSYIIISHDRKFLSNLTNDTIWVDRGQARDAPLALEDLRLGATKFGMKKIKNT